MSQPDNTILMEGVRIIFRNFAGKEGQYNKEGDRNFAVLLDEQVAQTLAADDWNVKWLNPREGEEEEAQAYLQVALKYRDIHGRELRPPRVVLITGRGRTNLDETQVEMLDWANILNVDLIIRPFAWGPINGKSGIKAYCQSLYVTIEEDPLEQKYNKLDQHRS